MYPPWWGVDSCLWRNEWSHRPQRCSSKHVTWVTSKKGSQALHIQPCLWDWSQHFGQFLGFKSKKSKNIHLCTAIPHTSSVGFCPNALNRMPTCHWSHATHNLCPTKNSWATEQRTCCGFKRPQVGGWPVFSSINGLIESSWPTEVPQLRLWPLLLWSNNLKLSRTFSFWSSEKR